MLGGRSRWQGTTIEPKGLTAALQSAPNEPAEDCVAPEVDEAACCCAGLGTEGQTALKTEPTGALTDVLTALTDSAAIAVPVAIAASTVAAAQDGDRTPASELQVGGVTVEATQQPGHTCAAENNRLTASAAQARGPEPETPAVTAKVSAVTATQSTTATDADGSQSAASLRSPPPPGRVVASDTVEGRLAVASDSWKSWHMRNGTYDRLNSRHLTVSDIMESRWWSLTNTARAQLEAERTASEEATIIRLLRSKHLAAQVAAASQDKAEGCSQLFCADKGDGVFCLERQQSCICGSEESQQQGQHQSCMQREHQC